MSSSSPLLLLLLLLLSAVLVAQGMAGYRKAQELLVRLHLCEPPDVDHEFHAGGVFHAGPEPASRAPARRAFLSQGTQVLFQFLPQGSVRKHVKVTVTPCLVVARWVLR